MKRVLLISFLLLITGSPFAIAYEPEQAMANQAHELAECAAYYTMMAGCAENTKPGDSMVDQLKGAAVNAYTLAAGLSNEKVTDSRIRMAVDQINTDMMNQCSNSSIAIEKYGNICLKALDEPKARTQYWLDKKD